MNTTISVDLHVRGEIPKELSGFLIVAASRRDKNRFRFSRWHDSQADIIRLTLTPGNPGKVEAHILPIEPGGVELDSGFQRSDYDRQAYGTSPEYGYATQPNHGLNIANGKLWATNLLFGAPIEIDLHNLQPLRLLRYVEVNPEAPRVTTTSHFAWSLDRRFAYFHQSLLRREKNGCPVQSENLCLIRLDIASGAERIWKILPPLEEPDLASANFHSAFYFEDQGKCYVGLLKTGAVIEHLGPHQSINDFAHPVERMPVSSIWVLELNEAQSFLQANLLPGIKRLRHIALSHLDVDNKPGGGFVLYANSKNSDVAEETHGENVYGEQPEEVIEHYSGMMAEGLNFGQVLRYEWKNGKYNIRTFERPYDHGINSRGHTWLPINIELDESKEFLFCSFSGLRPRLLSKNTADTYRDIAVNPFKVRYVPPLLMRFNAKTLRPDYDRSRSYLSYAEPVAITVIGSVGHGYVCTFSPEIGLRIYRSDDLSYMLCHAVSAELLSWGETHFRPEPAHMIFVPH